MIVLKGIGKFLLYSLIFFGMIVAHILVLVLFVWLSEIPLFAKLFSLYNSLTEGAFDFLPYTLCAFRCYLTNLFLQPVAFRLSGRFSLFAFSVAVIALDVYSLFLPASLTSNIMTIIEILFVSFLAVKCYKGNLNPSL